MPPVVAHHGPQGTTGVNTGHLMRRGIASRRLHLPYTNILLPLLHDACCHLRAYSRGLGQRGEAELFEARISCNQTYYESVSMKCNGLGRSPLKRVWASCVPPRLTWQQAYGLHIVGTDV